MELEQKVYSIGLDDNIIEELKDSLVNIFNYSESIEFCLDINNHQPDVVIINDIIKDMSPFLLMKIIRTNLNDKNIPIIFVSGSAQEKNIELILEYKVSTLIIKDNELAFKIKDKVITFKNRNNPRRMVLNNQFVWDKDLKVLFDEDKTVNFTFFETKLIELLIDNKNKIVTKEEIFYDIYIDKNKPYNDFTVRNLIKNIRKKVSHNFLKTVYGAGYKIDI